MSDHERWWIVSFEIQDDANTSNVIDFITGAYRNVDKAIDAAVREVTGGDDALRRSVRNRRHGETLYVTCSPRGETRCIQPLYLGEEE